MYQPVKVGEKITVGKNGHSQDESMVAQNVHNQDNPRVAKNGHNEENKTTKNGSRDDSVVG